MPGSDAARRLSADPFWQTFCWICGAALVWWSTQPGGVVPEGWAGWPAVIWIGLLIRGSLGARSGWAVAAVTWFAFSLVWGLQLAWIRHVSVAGWWPLAIYSAAYAVTLVVVVRWAAGRLRRMPLSVLTGVFGVAFEYIRAEVLFDAWPFHLAGHSFWGSAVSGLASLGGVWACSLVAYSCGGLVAAAFLSARRRSLWSEAALPAGLALIVVATGWIPLTPAPGSQPLEMLAVQTNLPQDNKVGWRPERQAEDVRSFLQMTRDGLETHEGTDLVVWPETMVPGLGFESETLGLLESYGPQTEAWSRWPREVSSAAAGSGVPWIVGSLTWTGVEVRDGVLEPAKRFNSAVLLTPTGSSERGDKMFLTPFGETMPYVRAWPWLERLVMDFGASGMRFDLDASDVPARLTLEIPGEPSWLIGVPICFEDAVPSVVRDVCVQDGEVVVDAIVNISNDGWFGDRDAARRAHAIAAAFRAIELGRPLLRVANTGESALFLPDGSNPASLPPRVAGTLAASMPRFDHRTLYARLGNWLPRLCVFLGVLILGAGLLAARGGLSSSAR